MGDRYIITLVCPGCGVIDDDVYYAPTCGFVKWQCSECGHVVDLEEYTGISAAGTSNADEIKALLDGFGIE